MNSIESNVCTHKHIYFVADNLVALSIAIQTSLVEVFFYFILFFFSLLLSAFIVLRVNYSRFSCSKNNSAVYKYHLNENFKKTIEKLKYTRCEFVRDDVKVADKERQSEKMFVIVSF